MSMAVGLAWYAQSQKECEELRAELARLRLTAAEREAVEFAAKRLLSSYVEEREIALTLRGLLQRTQTVGK